MDARDGAVARHPNDPPWLSLPSGISDVLRPYVPEVVAAIIDTVPRMVPTYSLPMEGRFGRGLRRGVAGALDRFLQLPGTRLPALSAETGLLVAGLGAGEFRQGRSMDALLGAYRTGARITFRELSKATLESGLGAEAVVDLGESILAYIDELSAVSVEAYAFEQSERAGELDRRRTALLELLLRGQTDEASLRAASLQADWVLPPRLAAVVLPLDTAPGLRVRLGHAALVVERDSDAVALVPMPPTAAARADVVRVLRGRRAVVGPAGSWEQVGSSLRLAQLAAAAVSVDEGADGPTDGHDAAEPVWAEDHLALIVMRAEPTAMTALARKRLAPLDELPAGPRARLEETLLAWLRHWGQRAPVAEELGIHPQTVGYRLGQLRSLLGAELEDPLARFELELALRARTLG
ncbi:PucR family transcriptional regulator [Zafaria sp. Z1313]|uniref:PucR family transcriptional regulator n=1 Tax=Zafaria sp. Z1313 TaxID=3423202 RepID=UPI003D30221D